jgi:uncharacterized coiled-coil protein SlyX
MGNSAYNRGSKRIREEISQELAGSARLREERLAVHNAVNASLLQAQKIEAQEAKIEELRQHLTEAQEKVRLQEAELTMLRDDIKATQRHAENMDNLRRVYLKEMEAHKEKHQILSDIIRLALTPEQYHQYREIVLNG